MSGYTIGEILVWLLLAAVLGFILGWLLRSLKCQKDHASSSAPAAEPAMASAGASAASVKPATLVDAAPVEADPVEAGTFAGSAKPLAGGKAPTPEYVIKGNEDSMIYHTPESPSYDRTIAETWFKSEADAVKAGFRKPKNA